jgi:NodT family efflux transporter outer membrane factor (OMF) lipoprotein
MNMIALCRRAALAGGGVLTLFLAGCTVGPNYEPPQPDMPATWAPPATTQPTTAPSMTITEPADVGQWWKNLQDPVLDSLIQRAIDSNLNLLQAQARVRQARASRRVTSAGLWPSVDSSAGYRRAGSNGDNTSDLYQAGLDASWELDVFGGTRRSVESADANIQSAVEDLRDILVTLTSEVAINYIDLRGLQRQIEIARSNLVLQRRSYDLTRQRNAAGLVGGLDTANAETSVAATESQIPLLEASVRQSVYSISILLGQQPTALLEELAPIRPIPSPPSVVSVGLPSELLRRRPDIRRAEANLHAATANIGVATSDLYPRFFINGSAGVAGSRVRNLFDWNAVTYSIGPSVSWPIFTAGRVRAGIAVQEAVRDQTLLAYQQTILTALSDVESSLVSYQKEQERRAALERAVAASRRAYNLSVELYTGPGNADFLNVLNAQRSLFASEDALAQSDRTIATNLISLYKALGGGWEPPPDEPAQ